MNAHVVITVNKDMLTKTNSHNRQIRELFENSLGITIARANVFRDVRIKCTALEVAMLLQGLQKLLVDINQIKIMVMDEHIFTSRELRKLENA